MKKYIGYILVAIGFVSVNGCKDYLDINTNPNQLTVTKPDFILSGALVETERIKSTGASINAYAGQWSGYFSASGSYSQSGDVVRTYILTNNYSNTPWANFYANLSNYNYVENKLAGVADNENYIAICEIMKAYDFQNLVDIFGDVPYKQALTGFQYLYPAYDDAQGIYKSLATKLDSAVLLIKSNPNATAVPVTTDVMFAGDMTLWAKLANTLHLRLLIHQSQVGDNAYISAEIAKINANGAGYLGAGENATINPGYTAAEGLQNPFWETNGASFAGVVGGRDYIRANEYAVAFFSDHSDPRIGRYFRKPSDNPGKNSGTLNSDYVGIKFGDLPATANNSANTSGFGPGILTSAAQPGVFLLAAESFFLQAEAALRSYIPGGAAAAQTLYEQGITESFLYLGLDEDDAADYYGNGQALVDWTATPPADYLEAIVTQKWAADYGTDVLEAWVDYRRVGFPSGIPISADPTKIATTMNPARLLYPQSEYNNNSINVNKVNNGAKVDQFATKIFWDK